MKKVVISFILILMVISTFSFAAYPAELENAELEMIDDTDLGEMEETEIEPKVLEDAEVTTIEPRNSIGSDEIISDDVYKMEDEITLTKVIDGNVYIMAQDVKITESVIYGNLYVMAQNIEIVSSEINGSIYAMGEKIKFSGITNDAYLLGSEIDLSSDSYIWRNVRVAGGTVNLNGSIARNVYATVSNLSIGDNAEISGKLNYTSESEGNISENAKISELQFNKQEIKEKQTEDVNAMSYVYKALGIAFKTLIVTLIIVFVVNKFKTLKRTNNVAIDFLKNTAKGALVLVIVPILSILLMISVIGLGFGFVALALYVIALYMATSIMAVEIAQRILNKSQENEIKKGKTILVSVLVSLVIWGISFIPVLGGIVNFIILLMGLGIIFDLIFQRTKKEEVNEN